MDIQFDFEAELKKLDEKIKDAQENLGDVEVRDAILEKAVFYEKNNDLEKAIENYQLAITKTIGVGKKLDIVFSMMKILLGKQDLTRLTKKIEECKKLLEEGGDWERRNRLKVYEGLYFILIRDFKKAAITLLDTVSTFSSPEILPYKDLVLYTVLTSLVSLGRREIKDKVIHSPDILGVIREIPYLREFMESFYYCKYKDFFQAFAKIIERISTDKYFSLHRKYHIKEMRIVAYSQFLESYKTVTIQNMANSFGVSSEFIDKELSDLISSRRLTCKIDKVQGIVESERIDERNGLYQDAIKQGDFLLNRIQKLSRIADIS